MDHNLSSPVLIHQKVQVILYRYPSYNWNHGSQPQQPASNPPESSSTDPSPEPEPDQSQPDPPVQFNPTPYQHQQYYQQNFNYNPSPYQPSYYPNSLPW